MRSIVFVAALAVTVLVPAVALYRVLRVRRAFSTAAEQATYNVLHKANEAAPPFRYARLDVDGEPGGGIVRTNQIGAGHAVAFDACGNVLWSASISERGAATPMRSQLMKLVP